jgi:hypothetical protein
VLARIVDNWLTSAGELGYQTPFTQLIAAEGYRVLHAPVHHPYEHGKDIVAVSPGGELHAFQLKGGDIGLAELEKIQGQLFALAGTVVSYPGVEPPRRPDRVHLVTNGRLTAPARDRLSAFNDANRGLGFPPVEAIERDQLVGRFVAASGNYFPAEPRDINRFLEILLSDGRGPVDKQRVASFFDAHSAEERETAPLGWQRSISSAVLFAAYFSGPWQRSGNNLGIAEVWLLLAASILRIAERESLDDDRWELSYLLALEAARSALRDLLQEAYAAEDLVIPHLAEGLVYPTRAGVVCGYCSALFLSQRIDGDAEALAAELKALLLREQPFIQIAGEAGVPLIVTIATAAELLGEPVMAGFMVSRIAQELSSANQPNSNEAVPDPYHSIDEVLLHRVGGQTTLDDEDFAGEVYTLHVLIDWFARRNYRGQAAKLWPNASRLHFCEFRPSTPAGVLAHDDPRGKLATWALPQPTSWGQLRNASQSVRESSLPMTLWKHLEFLPFLGLVYPYRLSGDVAKALDYVSRGLCSVTFDDLAADETVSKSDSTAT